MSGKDSKYNIEITKSDKKASTAVNSFKIRKSGNSSIVTVPNEVKETLGVKDGEEIQYVTVKDENDESMVIMKRLDMNKKKDQTTDKEVDKLLDQTLDELDDILQALVEL